MHQEKKMLAHISEDGTRVQTVADPFAGNGSPMWAICSSL